MQRSITPVTPRHATHSNRDIPPPEAVPTDPDGAPSGAAHRASTGLLAGATPARSGRQRRGAHVLAASTALVLALSACGGNEPPDNGLDGTMPDLSTSSDNGGASDNGGTDNTAASDAGGDSTGEDLAASIPAPDPADYPGMDQNTPEGAEQAFKYYIAVLTWAHQSGDTELVSTLHSEDCSDCVEFEGYIQEAREANLLWRSVEHQAGKSVIYDSDKYDHEIGLFFILSEHQEPNHDYSEYATVPESEIFAVGGLAWEEGRWKLAAYSSDVKEI
ncbi:DUF6318 family protein [Brachybacterium timonense]|uniref:DUF6318 family protein n=1 Tax=Brachybacterium timonense TaxID=2050896 RepID=UPI00110D8BC7|nr:DUF6318 family protein [Brachybacterium timonense]